MIGVTFHTGPPYAAMAARLAASAGRVGLTFRCVERKDLGTWVANVNQKAEVILETMDLHPERESVLWVDADSEFVDFPDCMIGVSGTHDASLFWHFGYVWGSTMRFSITPGGRSLVEAWRAQCRLTPQYSSDSNLKATLDANPKTWSLGPMPIEYLACRDPEVAGLGFIRRPVIRHYGMIGGDARARYVIRKQGE